MVNWFYKMEAGVFPARQPKLEGWILDFKSSPFLYVLGFCVVGFIIVQSVFFLVRAWRRGKQLGMTTATLKNTVVSSALFTIAPALAIVATVLKMCIRDRHRLLKALSYLVCRDKESCLAPFFAPLPFQFESAVRRKGAALGRGFLALPQ